MAMRWCDSWRRLRALAARLRRAGGGAAAAEFAVLVPLVLVLLSGTVNLGAMADYGLALDASVRDAADFAMTCSYDSATIHVYCTGMSGSPSHPTMCSIITGQTSNPCSSTTVTVGFLNSQYTPSAAGYPQYCTWDNDTATRIDCSLTCDATKNQCPKHTYITIKATESLKGVFEWLGVPESVSRTLTFRVS
jgi:Flp pilus assembly protein TadG